MKTLKCRFIVFNSYGSVPRRNFKKNKGRLKKLLNFFAGRRFLRRVKLPYGRRVNMLIHVVAHEMILKQHSAKLQISEKGEIVIWQKSKHADSCHGVRDDSQATFCKAADADDVWYKKMELCITPYSTGNNDEVSGDDLKAFRERFYVVPPKIASGSVSGVSTEIYPEDNRKWKKHVSACKKINKIIDSGSYRNIMDMNAGLGSFAAAIQSPKLWVMNVMPTIAEKNTLGVVYERAKSMHVQFT